MKVHHVDIEDLLSARVLFGSLRIHAEVSTKRISCRGNFLLSMNCNSGSVRNFCVSLLALWLCRGDGLLPQVWKMVSEAEAEEKKSDDLNAAMEYVGGF